MELNENKNPNPQQDQELSEKAYNELVTVRRDKLKALQEAGNDPFQKTKYPQDAFAADIKKEYDYLAAEEETDRTVCMAGRMMSKRVMGKASFADLRDASGNIQLYVRRDVIGEEEYAGFKKFDIGDVIGIKGQVFRTKMGEISIRCTEVVLLAKSLLPLPEKFHGLKDQELRYRQRYVDLIMNPEVRRTFEIRSRFIRFMRSYLDQRNYMEVETPVLNTIAGGAAARPFITHHNTLDLDMYMRIATELPLKRLIVGGIDRVYEIGRIFRNEGMDLTHNPEFTTMEAYRAYSDLEGMKELAEGVIKAAARAVGLEGTILYQDQEIDLFGAWPSRPMTEIVSDVLGVEVTMDTPVEELAAHAAKHGIEVKQDWGPGKIIAEIYDEIGEDSIVNPTFVCDYPVEVSPLAKRNEEDPRLTHRFELVIAGHEYANAFSELNDPVDQAERFARQMEEKAEGDDEAMEYDEDYVRALEYGMPPAGGIGIGIDRVVMLLTNSASIRDVLLFPHMRPEGKKKLGAQQGGQTASDEQAAAGIYAPNKVPTIDFSKVAVEPLFADEVDFETFSKSDFRAVKVKECIAVPKSKKLLQFTLDDGTGEDRTILSGIHPYYEPEDLVGKTLVAITNLPPRKMMGIDSCGMLLSAIHEEAGEERLNLLMLDSAIPAGAKLY